MLAENVSNSDTPNFKPRDLVEPKFDAEAASGHRWRVAGDDAHQRHHIAPSGAGRTFDQNRQAGFETRPAGNAVNLEDEMLKACQPTRWIMRRRPRSTAEPASSEDRDRQGAEARTRTAESRQHGRRSWRARDFARSMGIATSGLRAQAGRMRVISENIANADSTAQTAGGDPYRRKVPTFSSALDRALDAKVVTLGRIKPDQSPSASNTSRAIRRRMPPAMSNIPTSIRWSK